MDLKPAVDLWMERTKWGLQQGQGGASAAISSSTMKEVETEDGEVDTEEDSEEDCAY